MEAGTASGWMVEAGPAKRRDGSHQPDVVDLRAQEVASEWAVRGRLRVVDGQLVLEHLTFHSPPPGVTSGMLRQLPLGLILAAARRQLEQLGHAANMTDAPVNDFTTAARELAQQVDPAQMRRGRHGYPDDFYRRIAFAYLALQEQRESARGLLDDLAEAENKPRETIRDWVREARTRGFLSPTTRGRAGASPGPKLYIEGTK